METLGLPLVLDKVTAKAMWHEANISKTQQRVPKRYFHAHFSKKVIIPKALLGLLIQLGVPTQYGEYKCDQQLESGPQDPDQCQFWYQDISIVVTKDIERC